MVRGFSFTCSAACLWLTLAAVALAQQVGEGGGEQEEAGKSLVSSYILIVLCVALGMVAVCRMGKRRNPKIRRRDDEDE